MQLSFNRRTGRLIVLGLVALIALAAWVSASAQPQPPFLLYGDGSAGDTIGVYDAEGAEVGVATVGSDGTWHVNVDGDAEQVEGLSFTLNGSPVEAAINQTGEDQARVTLSEASDDAMAEGETTSEDDELMEEGDEPMEEESMEDEQAEASYPESGSGGLAESGPSTSALVGTILVLVALGVGVGVWKLRRRV